MINNSDFVIEKGSLTDPEALVLKQYLGTDEHVIIPDGINEIDWFAFTNPVKSIEIPKSLRSLDPRVFRDYGKSLDDGSGICRAGRFLLNYTGSDDVLFIPEGITETCFCSVSNNQTIRKVVFPSTIEVIGNQTFAGCNNLEEVEFASGGNSLKEIQPLAFANCFNLQTINLPNKTIEIGVDAFSGCSKLDSVTDFEIIGSVLIKCKSNEKSISIPSGVTIIGGKAFNGCVNAETVIIPEGVEAIGEWAFYNMKNLENVSFPNSLKRIYSHAFCQCSSLKEANLKNVEIIGESAFSSCTALKISLPASLKEIGDEAFYSCTSLTEISLSDKLKKLGAGNTDNKDMHSVFYNDPIEQIEIPKSISELDSYLFQNTKLKSIKIPGNIKVVGRGTFWGCEYLESVEIEEGTVEIKSQAFLGCEKLSRIVLPDSLEIIGEDAFYNCPKLKNIKLPASIADGKSENEKSEYLGKIGIPDENGCIVSDGVLVRYDGPAGIIRVADGVEIIPKNVFSYWFGFRAPAPTTQIILPDSVRLIEDESFKDTWQLKEMNIPEGYLQQTTKLPKKPTLTLLNGVWRDKATVKDYVYLLFFQRDKEIASCCKRRLAKNMDEALSEIKKVLLSIGDKNHYVITANFILENLKKASPEDINDVFQMAKDVNANKAIKLLEPLFTSAEIEKNNTKQGEVPTDVVMCALVPYMKSLKTKPNGDDYKYYYSPLFFSRLTFRKTADKIADTFNRDSFESILDSLIGNDIPSALETLVPYGRYASGKQISNLINRMKRWEKWSDYKKLGREAYIVAKGAIMLNDSKEAIMFAEKQEIFKF